VGDEIQSLTGALAVVAARKTGPPEGNDLSPNAGGIHKRITLPIAINTAKRTHRRTIFA
jgi:hypothetical protein